MQVSAHYLSGGREGSRSVDPVVSMLLHAAVASVWGATTAWVGLKEVLISEAFVLGVGEALFYQVLH